jgi:hypothetical protein
MLSVLFFICCNGAKNRRQWREESMGDVGASQNCPTHNDRFIQEEAPNIVDSTPQSILKSVPRI